MGCFDSQNSIFNINSLFLILKIALKDAATSVTSDFNGYHFFKSIAFLVLMMGISFMASHIHKSEEAIRRTMDRLRTTYFLKDVRTSMRRRNMLTKENIALVNESMPETIDLSLLVQVETLSLPYVKKCCTKIFGYIYTIFNWCRN